jgi:hypothetical protein
METSNLQADSKSLDTLPIESRYSCDLARANNQSRHIAKCNENQGEIGISQTMMPGAAIRLATAKKIIPHARSLANPYGALRDSRSGLTRRGKQHIAYRQQLLK